MHKIFQDSNLRLHGGDAVEARGVEQVVEEGRERRRAEERRELREEAAAERVPERRHAGVVDGRELARAVAEEARHVGPAAGEPGRDGELDVARVKEDYSVKS